jgi:hypothetical protein
VLYLDRNCVLAHFNIGLIYWKRRNIDRACRAWDAAQSLLKSVPVADEIPFSDGLPAGYFLNVIKQYLTTILSD